MTKRTYKPFILAASALIIATYVTACKGGSSQSPLSETTAASYDTAAGISSSYAIAETAASFSENMMDGGYYSDDYEKDMALEEEGFAVPMEAPAQSPAPDPTAAKPQAPSSNSDKPAINRKLIRTVSLDVETTAFDNLLSSIEGSVTNIGGYIEQSDVSGTSISASQDRRRYAYLTVRIPSDSLDGFLSQMAEQSNVINRSENVQDVTLQYTDIESRKKSLTIEQERLWTLLEKADTLEAVIALEERLSEIRYQLEGFESQLRTYDNQVDYSTVHISIQEVGVFTPTAPDSIGTRIQKGFVRNLEYLTLCLTDLLVWFLSHLPSLVLLALVIGILLFLVKTVGRKKGAKQGKTDTSAKLFSVSFPKAGKKDSPHPEISLPMTDQTGRDSTPAPEAAQNTSYSNDSGASSLSPTNNDSNHPTA